MANIQDQLIRASAVARLERIVGALLERVAVPVGERRWFAEQLSPFHDATAGGPARIVPSSGGVSRPTSSAILDLIREDLRGAPDMAQLQNYIVDLAKLRGALLSEAALSKEEEERTLDLAPRRGIRRAA